MREKPYGLWMLPKNPKQRFLPQVTAHHKGATTKAPQTDTIGALHHTGTTLQDLGSDNSGPFFYAYQANLG